ncbi:MAG: conjugative transposon protein TraM, partial [Chitinophagaceae bacterium]
EILPLKLEIYDNDGLPGIYVPASAFREFSKELSSSAASAGSSPEIRSDNRMVMSMISGVFQSANTAVNKMIRRNKAKLKYDTRIYLIDTESLKNKQNSYK